MKDMEGNDRSLKKDSIPLFAGTEWRKLRDT
jgi:hypothetical protein